jgi:hypothetical protein
MPLRAIANVLRGETDFVSAGIFSYAVGDGFNHCKHRRKNRRGKKLLT